MSSLKKFAVWTAIIAAIVFVFWLVSPSDNSKTSSGSKPVAGAMAPDFSLPATDGTTTALSSFRGKQNVLIYFSEGLTCDPCMQQMPELDKYTPAFSNLNVKVLYVTMDSLGDSKDAMNRYGIKAPVFSYANDSRITQDYSLLPYSMDMGNRAGHTFILVGKDGKILWRKDYWPGLGMSVPGGTMFVKGQEIADQVTKALGGQS